MKSRANSGSLRRREAVAEGHRDVLPAVVCGLVEDLQVAADALDVHVQREHAFEGGREHEQRDQRAERHA